MNSEIRFRNIFRFREDTSSTLTVYNCPLSPPAPRQPIFSVTPQGKSDKTRTLENQRYSQKTCVCVVNDYDDMTKTKRTLSEKFEGFSQILKEQSGEKRLVCLQTQQQ